MCSVLFTRGATTYLRTEDLKKDNTSYIDDELWVPISILKAYIVLSFICVYILVLLVLTHIHLCCGVGSTGAGVPPQICLRTVN